MGWKRDIDGVWRSEGEIKARDHQVAKLGCWLSVLVVPVILIFGLLQKLGIIKSDDDGKPTVIEVVESRPTGASASQPRSEQRPPSTVEGPKPPPPPTPMMARIAQLIATTPKEGTAALFKTYHGVWQTTETIIFAGELEQRAAAGVLFRVLIPENPEDKVLTQYTVEGAGKWSPWVESELDVATGLFGGSEHSYATIRLSPVQDLIFTSEESIMFSMVTKPGKNAEMVTMNQVELSAVELPEPPSELATAVVEALSIFKDGSLDEAKVVVSRLEEAATRFPDDSTITQLRDHILAVFRAENALEALKGKVVRSDQLEVDSAKLGLREALEKAEEFCREMGEDVDVLKRVLKEMKRRSGL